MKRTKQILLGLVLILLAGSSVGAGEVEPKRFEITPYLGYRFGGEIENALREGLFVGDLGIQEAASYGLTFDIGLGEDWQIELLWSRQSTDLRVDERTGETTLFDLDVDYYHVGGVYLLGDEEAQTRPFFVFSLGATRYLPEGGLSSATNFSAGLGGGVKVRFGSHIGLRFDLRWVPTWFASSDDVFCSDSASGRTCYGIPDGTVVSQAELGAGLMIRF